LLVKTKSRCESVTKHLANNTGVCGGKDNAVIKINHEHCNDSRGPIYLRRIRLLFLFAIPIALSQRIVQKTEESTKAS